MAAEVLVLGSGRAGDEVAEVTTLEGLVSQLKSQGQYLTQQLASLPKIS